MALPGIIDKAAVVHSLQRGQHFDRLNTNLDQRSRPHCDQKSGRRRTDLKRPKDLTKHKRRRRLPWTLRRLERSLRAPPRGLPESEKNTRGRFFGGSQIIPGHRGQFPPLSSSLIIEIKTSSIGGQMRSI